ncbi:MAG TPA: hypothetical protein DCR16_07025 [Lachnospiraceae bacterium]|nr:hypothetical protein [Lachnospiraceae bacterium]
MDHPARLRENGTYRWKARGVMPAGGRRKKESSAGSAGWESRTVKAERPSVRGGTYREQICGFS